MRNWTIPEQWSKPEEKAPETSSPKVAVQVRSTRRQPLRRSGGFIQIDNVFAELDAEYDKDFDPGTLQH
jgi:hypothetical protein